MLCTFFGHSDCYDFDMKILKCTIEELILKGVDTFYVGHQGHFDSMVLECLSEFKEIYQNLSFSVVFAYLPTKKYECDLYHEYSIYPEGMEIGHPRFAVERRNRWMIEHAHYCICYINHAYGGAYKFARLAKKKGLTVINLGSAEL